MTNKFVIIYEYFNYDNFRSKEISCLHLKKKEYILASIKIYKIDRYFNLADKSSSAEMLLKSRDTININIKNQL